MARDTWRTYNSRQAQQIWSGLQVLLDQGLLTENERTAARSVQRKLEYRAVEAGEPTLIQFTDKEDALLSQVEGTLWR